MRLRLLLLPLLLSGCVSHTTAREFHGLTGIRGEPIEYQVTTSYGIHLFFTWPILGSAKKVDTISRFNAEASARGGKRVRIARSETNYWGSLLLLPLSLIFTPVVTTVEGDVEGAAGGL